MRTITRKSGYIYIPIIILAYLNAAAVQYVTFINGDYGIYYGTQIISFMPESILWFSLCFVLLKRFLTGEVWKEKSRTILSVIFGFFMGFTAVWAQEALYNITLWDNSDRLFKAFVATFGLMIFTVPMFSELVGLFNRLSCMFGSQARVSSGKTIGKVIRYGLLSWLTFFASYVPIFLWTYPINFFGDARDALNTDYLLGKATTHHSAIHWILMSKFYELGVRHGSVAFGMQFFTLLQMLVLSGSIAYLMTYLYKKGISKKLRVGIFLVFLSNPVNAYFSVTAEKGTIGIALALFAMVVLMEIMDMTAEKDMKSLLKSPVLYVRVILFALSMSAGALFRNNMIYAVMVGGLIIAVLAKGFKKKTLFLIVFVLTFVFFKTESSCLTKNYGLSSPDKYRETFPVPIICLSRVAYLHGDEIPADVYNEIITYIPEGAIANYSISDHLDLKFASNEIMLRDQTKRFIKLFVKCGLMYPKDYIDQIGWMTMGYFNPLYAHVLGSTTNVFYTPLDDQFMQIEHKNLLPIGSRIFDWMYYENGRFQMPLFSFFYRPVMYVWMTFFAFAYGIYRKDKRRVALSLIPLLYFGTILLGPICQFRYIYLNVLFLGLILFVSLDDRAYVNKN